MSAKSIKLAVCAAILAGSANANANTVVDPFTINPFVVPDEYQAQLKNYRSTWSRMTGFEYSGLHWNQFIVVYLSQGADAYRNNYSEYLRYYQDYDEDEDEEEIAEPSFKFYPTGTVVLKENFIADNGTPNTPISVTMMIKHEDGYDPQAGNWEYVQFDPAGNVILKGNSQDAVVNKACANCHINIADRDYIFANYYSKSK